MTTPFKILSLLLSIVLTACATQPLYSPASRPDASGYWETRLTDNRYRVTFTGRNSTARETVKNYAMLRAAELTINSGYDWFKIVERESDGRSVNRSEPRVSVSVGVGSGCRPFGCRVLGSSWYTGVLVDPIAYNDRFQTSLEILIGKGEPDDPNSVYDARELASHLKGTTILTSDRVISNP